MKKLLTTLALVFAVVWPAYAVDSFVIESIDLEGLQRISKGTVLNYLPLEPGDTLDTQSAQLAIRELYRTGFFRDIELRRKGNTLIIQLSERPAISNITISGNDAIKTKDLLRVLRRIGLYEGNVFNRMQLDRLEQELIRQYNSRGRYSVSVETTVTPLKRNRVKIDIDIDEGETASIKHLNIVGNTVFGQETLLDEFEISSTNLFSFWTADDQYSRDKLSGDLETLRSYYMDRGYLEYELESAQVAITPDKSKIAITINIDEGKVYTVSDVGVTGKLIIPREDLKELIEVEPGEIFSRKEVQESADNITRVLANIGYAFANVTPVPHVNEKQQTVKLTFFIQPGNRVYVRRIEFFGNYKTRDIVLRREMRLLEGEWFSQAALERSRLRLQRLGYFSKVTMETPRVPGTDDQVDIHVTVKERHFGTVTGGFGYSQNIGLILNFSLRQRNFLGTGKFVGLGLNYSDAFASFHVRYVNPYWTENGVSRGFSFSYQEMDRGEFNVRDFSQDTISVGTSIGVPITEVDALRLSLDVRRTSIDPGIRATQEMLDFLSANGTSFTTLLVTPTYIHDTRDDFFFPTSGNLQRVGLAVTVPPSNIEYYRFTYRGEFYWPLTDTFTFSIRAEIGYGDGYGETDELPFFQNFYGGGVDDVRGFRANTLGPKGPYGFPLGGSVKLFGSIAVLFPTPLLSDVAATRTGIFLDFGNIWDGIDTVNLHETRGSIGIGTSWQSPMGLISISLAYPLNDQPGDQIEVLQFKFGTVF